MTLACGCKGVGFHYLLRDCCRLLEHWWNPTLANAPCGDNASTSGVEDARAFVSHLIRCSSDKKNDVLKSNLHHIRAICELYAGGGGGEVVVDPCDIWSMFTCRGKGKDVPWLTQLMQQETTTINSNGGSSSSSSSEGGTSAVVVKWRDRMHRVSLYLMAICVKNQYPLQTPKLRSSTNLSEKQLYIHKVRPLSKTISFF